MSAAKPGDEDDLLVTKPTAQDSKNDKEDNGSSSDSDSDEDVDEDGLQWWEKENLQASKKGEKRWNTLSHNGPYFEPEYEPHGLPIRYAGQEFKMVPAVEEVATMYAVMRESPYYHNEVFRANFFRSWREVMAKSQPQLREVVRELGLVDFGNIWNWHSKNVEARKNAPKDVKKKLAEEKKALTAKHQECLWDGRKEKVANFRVEPPGLFRGRGKHPLMGQLKRRVYPEDITINIGKGEKIPDSIPGHKWGQVIHDNTVTWLAMWEDNVTHNHKYVMLAPTSMIKGMSDREKFERARRLKDVIDTIRADYRANWNSKSIVDRQLGVALYFIDKLALRVGNEKGGDEADTVGCCSLRKEHIKPEEDNRITLDFLGKDSIRFFQTVEVDPKVHSLIRELTAGKRQDQGIFDQISPQQLNDYLKKHMSDLTAKVFRTYNASICLDKLLRIDPPPKSATEGEKLVFFNKCNTEVALLCNHQKAVGKGHFKTQKANSEKLDYAKKNIQRLEDLKIRIGEVGRKKALDEFYAEEDKIHHDWLENHGTEKQKADYADHVAKRDAKRQKEKADGSSSKSKSKSSSSATGSKRTRSSSSSKKDKNKKTRAEPASSSKKSLKKEEPADVEEDENLASLLNAKKPASKAKTEVKEEKKTVKKESPKVSPKKSTKKPSPKTSPKKSAAAKKAPSPPPPKKGAKKAPPKPAKKAAPPVKKGKK